MPKTIREQCKNFISNVLEKNGGTIYSSELEELLTGNGYSFSTWKRARAELKRCGKITTHREKFGKDGRWYVVLRSVEQ